MRGSGRLVGAVRFVLGAGGLVVIGAGVASLVGTPLAALVAIVVFLALGVVVHDGVIAPLTLAGAATARRVLPRGYLAPLVVATALLGALSVMAFPVLLGINESPDNATVDNRPYRTTWLVLLAVTVVAVIVAGAVRSAHHRATPDAPSSRETVGAARVGAGRAGAPRGADGTVLERPRRADRAEPLALVTTAVVVVVSALRAVRPTRGPGPGSGRRT